MEQGVEGGGMTVKVLLFSQLKDRLGESELLLTLPSNSTGRALREALIRRDPSIKPLLEVSRLAVGQEYVAWEYPLPEGAEAAVLPPVSGG